MLLAPSSKMHTIQNSNSKNEAVCDDEEPTDKCRVCTISSDCFSYLNIFEKIIFKNVLVLDALSLITNLQIYPDDGLPQTICCRCEQRLLDAYHFRRLAESSAKQFEMLNKSLNQSIEFEQNPKTEEITIESNNTETSQSVHNDTFEVILMDNDSVEMFEEHLSPQFTQVDIVEPTIIETNNLIEQIVPPKRKSMILQRLSSKRPQRQQMSTDEPKSYKSSVIKQSSKPKLLNRTLQRNKKSNSEDVVSFLIERIDPEQHQTVPSSSHADSTDPEYSKRKHECQVCHKRFVGKSNLVDHLRFHANVKPFKCDQCEKSFVQSGSLRCHLRTHTKEKPFVCPYCAKAFGQSSSLKIHIRTHTQERGYSCDLCDKRFKSNSDLGKHRGIHDLVKRYKCDICNHSFAQNGNLQKHIRRNHGENAVQCDSSQQEAD